MLLFIIFDNSTCRERKKTNNFTTENFFFKFIIQFDKQDLFFIVQNPIERTFFSAVFLLREKKNCNCNPVFFFFSTEFSSIYFLWRQENKKKKLGAACCVSCSRRRGFVWRASSQCRCGNIRLEAIYVLVLAKPGTFFFLSPHYFHFFSAYTFMCWKGWCLRAPRQAQLSREYREKEVSLVGTLVIFTRIQTCAPCHFLL